MHDDIGNTKPKQNLYFLSLSSSLVSPSDFFQYAEGQCLTWTEHSPIVLETD